MLEADSKTLWYIISGKFLGIDYEIPFLNQSLRTF
jgi:predicted Rossmann fold nucleotide-binding protein DprA/Smf involved in DNA uptake